MSGFLGNRPNPGLTALRNGYLNRLLFTTPGAGAWTVPPFVERIKVAVIGGGGGGAFAAVEGLYSSLAPPGNAPVPLGGAGGGISIATLATRPGDVLNYVVGAAGAPGAITPPNSASFVGSAAGTAGGSSSATLAGRTLTATGGAGGPVQTTSVATAAAGGAGSGGDINNLGGSGGAPNGTPVGSSWSLWTGSGGGACGSPRGPGGSGGRAASPTTSVSTGPSVSMATGGGWGGPGMPSVIVPNNSGQAIPRGIAPSSIAPGRLLESNVSGFPVSASVRFPPNGGFPTLPGSWSSGAWGTLVNDPRELIWWDLDDVCGGSGPSMAGPGSGGTTLATYLSYPSEGNSLRPGQFGGGAAISPSGNFNNSPFMAGDLADQGALVSDAVLGGGGGSCLCSALSSFPGGRAARGGNGGVGAVIIWF